jgi:hypothetical protein
MKTVALCNNSKGFSGGMNYRIFLSDFEGNLYYSEDKMIFSRKEKENPLKPTPAKHYGIGKVKEIYSRRGAVFIITHDDHMYVQGTISNNSMKTYCAYSDDSDFSLVDVGQVKKMHAGEDILIETSDKELWSLPDFTPVRCGWMNDKNSPFFPLKKLNFPLDPEETKEFSNGPILTKMGMVYTREGKFWKILYTAPVQGLIRGRGFVYSDSAEIGFKSGGRSDEKPRKILVTNTKIEKTFTVGGRIIFVVG